MERKRKKRGAPKPAIPHHAEGRHAHLPKDRPYRRKKSRKGKRQKRSIWYHIGEVFDDFDDILDIFD